jgi:hypothetical protein
VYEYGQGFETGVSNIQYQGSPATDQATNLQPTNYFRLPPNTIAEAKIMPGSHTWAAQEGCYCVSKFQTENPFQSATRRNYIFNQNSTTADSLSGFGEAPGGLYTNGSVMSLGLDSRQKGANAPATHLSRMNTTGAYFTGLSGETTLFVTWRVGLERLPAANKPTFLALASPSASYDPNALVLYNLICNHLPPGVPQGYNDAGKWFRMISDVARRVIPRAFPLVGAAQAILTSIGRPKLAQAVGMIGGAAKAAADRANARNTAAQKLQNALRNRKGARGGPIGSGQAGNPRRQAVRNFNNSGTQQFSQMSGT